MHDPGLQSMLDLDERHWWFAGRRRIVVGEVARLPLRRAPRILDAGCGSGRNLVELARFGETSGIELTEQAAAFARTRRVGDVRVGPIEELPWPDATFDLVTCLDVLEHTPDDRRTLVELRRVTRPDGFLLLTVPRLRVAVVVARRRERSPPSLQPTVARRRRGGRRMGRRPADRVQLAAAPRPRRSCVSRSEGVRRRPEAGARSSN